jgi:hypothetical protein
MNFSAAERIRRFLLHIILKGSMRLRYYRFMANLIRRQSLTLIRKSLDKVIVKLEGVITDKIKDEIGPECPEYHHVGMFLIEIILLNTQLARFRLT